jgi:ribosomal-protein-alanine N-acetyltransferase
MTERMHQTPSEKENKEDLKLSFRKVTQEDIDAYLELERTAIGNKTYSGILDKDEALKEFSENEVYLMYKAGKLVGSTEFEMKSPDHAYLSGLVVHPDFQDQGIAREAILFRLEKLKGVKRIDVITHPENSKIIHLYESLGFKIEKRMENYFGDGEPRIMLVKEN